MKPTPRSAPRGPGNGPGSEVRGLMGTRPRRPDRSVLGMVYLWLRLLWWRF